MNLLTKIIIIILMFSFSGFSAFKNISSKAVKAIAETNISFEQKEKSDSESEDLKLAILDQNNLNLEKFLKSSNLRSDSEFSEFTPETPTSPPNC